MAFIDEIRGAYLEAHNGGYEYGDSQSVVPMADHKGACDRMIAKALWNMGFTDQPVGGITVLNMEYYLITWGFLKIVSVAQLMAGDIIMMYPKSGPPEWRHVFVLTAFDAKTLTCSKYDLGQKWRIDAPQPFQGVKLNEWDDKYFYCAFRLPNAATKAHSVDLYTVQFGDQGVNTLLVQEILKARGFGGTRELVLDGSCGPETVMAMNKYQDARRAQGVELGSGGRSDGICGPKMWKDLLGM